MGSLGATIKLFKKGVGDLYIHYLRKLNEKFKKQSGFKISDWIKYPDLFINASKSVN